MADVLGYLRDKGFHLKNAGDQNVHSACIFCQEDPGARGRLYINVNPDADIAGLYFCHRCGAKGNLVTLKRHYGDAVDGNDLDSATRAEILACAAAFYRRQLDKFPDVYAYLTGPRRGLLPATIDAHLIGYAPMGFNSDITNPGVHRPRRLYSTLRAAEFAPKDILATGLAVERDNHIVDALAGMVTIPYMVGGNVVAIRGRTWPQNAEDFASWQGPTYDPPPHKYKTLAGTATRLFNADIAWDAEEIAICEGEFDALVLEQEGHPALGVPGANVWQPAWDAYLEKPRRVYLIFDRDETGEKAATKLVERLGHKVRRVHLSEEGFKCDPTQWFAEGHTEDEFQHLLDMANRGGLLVSVSEAVEEFRNVQGNPGLRFAWDQLDSNIAPGLHGGQLFMILAKSGVGKTLFLLNMMQRARMVIGQEDIKILFLSLEQTRGEWWDRARRIHRFFNVDSNEDEAARWWRDNILMVDRNRLAEAELRQIIDDYGYQMGQLPDLVCLDYMGYFARGFRGEAYERTSQAVMTVKGVAKEYRIPVMAPHQVSRAGHDGEEFEASAARDSGVIEETADFLLTMWTPDNAIGRDEAEKTGQIHFRIAKSRHGGRGADPRMQMAPISLAMIPKDDPLGARARQEFEWRRLHASTWEEAAYRHRTGFDGHIDFTQRDWAQ